MISEFVTGPWPSAFASAFLCVIALTSVAAKRMFPSAEPRWEGHFIFQLALVFLAGAIVLPVSPLIKLASAMALCGVCVAGLVLHLVRGEKGCDCYGTLPPPGPLYHICISIIAIASTAVLVFATDQLASQRSVLGPPLIATGAFGICLISMSFIRYKRKFYSRLSNRSESLPDSLDPDQLAGFDLSNHAVTIGDALGDSRGLLIVSLSSSCASCRKLVEDIGERVEGQTLMFAVVFVADRQGILSDVRFRGICLVDPEMGVARKVLASAMPMAVALNEQRELIAPPSLGSQNILQLLEMLISAERSDDRSIS